MTAAAITRRMSLGMAAAGMALAAVPAQADEAIDTEAIDAIVRDALAQACAPGLQIAVGVGGRTVLSRAYGMANLETGTAVTPRSVFRIASLTKQFTAAAIHRLAEAGPLTLDDPVATWLPAFLALPTLTLAELMHQTAGLHSDESEPLPGVGTLSQMQLAEAIAAQAQPLDFPPGTAWLYSNANYIVLGGVIEAATGKPYVQAMRDLIFGPLALPATAMDRSSEVVPGRVSGYSLSAFEGVTFDNAAPIPVEQAGGAGSIRSTAEDLCAWGHGLLSGCLLTPASLTRMTTPGRLRDGRLSGDNRFSPDDAVYGDVQYASGLLVSPPSEPPASLLHYGGIDGFCSMLEIWPARGVTLAIMCNADRGPATPFSTIRRHIRARLQAL